MRRSSRHLPRRVCACGQRDVRDSLTYARVLGRMRLRRLCVTLSSYALSFTRVFRSNSAVTFSMGGLSFTAD